MSAQINIRKQGQGFYEEQEEIKILHLKGKPYDMGFQHGSLLADRINDLILRALDATVAVISKSIGIDHDTAWKKMIEGSTAATPFFPPEYLEEMQGITDGVTSKTNCKTTLADIILWNTMYDQWCLYAHPHYSAIRKNESNKCSCHEKSNSNTISGAGCSSFSAWGNAVKGEMLVFGKNMDNLNLPGILDNRMLVIVDPDNGMGHAFVTHPGMIGIDGGMNSAGITMMTHYDAFCDETMEGCGIGTLTRLLLAQSKTFDQAVQILKEYPHCTGIAFHVTDSNLEKAAIVNASSEKICIRHPMEGQDVLFSSNHTNCFPGWYGYDGDNMVNDQKNVYELSDVGTIEKWQNSLRDPDNFHVPAPSRFERYEQLMNEHYGNITPDIARQILSDRHDPYTGKTRAKHETSVSNNILATICALYPDLDYYEDIPAKKFLAHVSNLWSMVMTPKNGDFWLAIRGFPAQYSGYVPFNLNAELSKISAQIQS